MENKDSRKAQRVTAELPMKMTLSSKKSFMIKTWDFSANGVFLEVSNDIIDQVDVNDTVEVQFQETNFQPPVMLAQIIRITDKGIALSLKETLIEGDAPEG